MKSQNYETSIGKIVKIYDQHVQEMKHTNCFCSNLATVLMEYLNNHDEKLDEEIIIGIANCKTGSIIFENFLWSFRFVFQNYYEKKVEVNKS
jgi:hypothetical protein